MSQFLLAIDQGTTNSRAILFDREGNAKFQHDVGLNQTFPHDGWVEQDPDEMYQNTVLCCQEVVKKADIHPSQVAGIGIANQRETTIIWHKKTGKPIYPAIVWQDRRTADSCKRWFSHEKTIIKKTGLLVDPYFSATKIVWILENVPNARQMAEAGELLFGTVDTYLLWKLTDGRVHLTDITNAARTLLFNIHTQKWDDELLKIFNIPENLLPDVVDNTFDFGETLILGQSTPIVAMVGDQQAATVGQACFSKGMVKVTYGTGCFMVLNTGNQVIQSTHHLIATIAYRIKGELAYGLEGSIFCAGVTVKWLRDALKMISDVAETEAIAASVPDTGNVYFVPAFTGLGAPHWNPNARGALLGLTGNSVREHIVRAALESVAYQTKDLLEAMIQDSQLQLETLRVDGGMVKNNWLLQFLADILRVVVERPTCIETSALGAAYLAGIQLGWFNSLSEVAEHWRIERRFSPNLPQATSEKLYAGWIKAVNRLL